MSARRVVLRRTFIANSNFNTERTSIHEDVRDFKAQLLGVAQQSTQLDLFEDDGVPLLDQEISSTFERNKDDHLQMTIHFIIRNSGDALSGPMYVKVYTRPPLQLGGTTTAEHGYKYEDGSFPSHPP